MKCLRIPLFLCMFSASVEYLNLVNHNPIHKVKNGISEYGFLAKHPTTGNAIASPYVSMSQMYMKQVNQIWYQIYQIVKETDSTIPSSLAYFRTRPVYSAYSHNVWQVSINSGLRFSNSPVLPLY